MTTFLAHRITRAAFAAVLACSLLAGAGIAAGVEVPFFAENASNEAILSEMALHPASIKRGTVTYIAYQGPGYDPYVASYDDATGTWDGPYRAGENPLLLDAHGAPAIFFDAQGRLHVIFGSHSRPMWHSRASVPGRIDVWEDLPYIDTVGTYPQIMDAADGRALLFYRTVDYDWVLRTSDANREVFGEATSILAGAADTWWYADFRPAGNGAVNAAFVWVNNFARLTGETWGRENAYYMHRNPDGSWQDATGTPVAIPVDHETADEKVRIFDSAGNAVNEISVKQDSEDVPCVLFLTGSGSGPGAFTWTFARLEDGAWRFTPIATTDHYFDSGAILPGEGASIEAVLVTGENDATGTVGTDMRGRGGKLERFISDDHGLTWRSLGFISPDEPGIDFGDPQFVDGGSGDERLVFCEWNNDPGNFFNRMFLWGESGLVTRDITSTVKRVAGPARAQTAVEISKMGFPEGARTVVLATEKDFPDALAGVPLAQRLEAPLLLTAPDGLSPGVADEILRVGATTAVLLGGPNALGPEVEADLYRDAGIKSIQRIQGIDRYETALEISRRLYDPTHTVTNAVVVSGQDWPDAATGAPLAAAWGVPILLTKRDEVPGPTLVALSEWGTTSTVVIGGTAVIGDSAEDLLPGPVRVAGATRYETAQKVAEYGSRVCMLPYRALVATGLKFPDALAGATLAARLRAPVLLTMPDPLSEPASAYLLDNASNITRLVILGDTAVVSDDIERALAKMLGASGS